MNTISKALKVAEVDPSTQSPAFTIHFDPEMIQSTLYVLIKIIVVIYSYFSCQTTFLLQFNKKIGVMFNWAPWVSLKGKIIPSASQKLKH